MYLIFLTLFLQFIEYLNYYSCIDLPSPPPTTPGVETPSPTKGLADTTTPPPPPSPTKGLTDTTTTTTTKATPSASFCAGRADGVYAKPDAPGSFYNCGHGITHIQNCAVGLVFRDSCKCCDWP